MTDYVFMTRRRDRQGYRANRLNWSIDMESFKDYEGFQMKSFKEKETDRIQV